MQHVLNISLLMYMGKPFLRIKFSDQYQTFNYDLFILFFKMKLQLVFYVLYKLCIDFYIYFKQFVVFEYVSIGVVWSRDISATKEIWKFTNFRFEIPFTISTDAIFFFPLRSTENILRQVNSRMRGKYNFFLILRSTSI